MGEPNESASRAQEDRLSQVDLYCLECGYNLRGLSGDPRRCPECGHLNPVEVLEIPAKLITAQRRRMETAPALCVGAIVLVVMSAMITALVWLNMRYFEIQAYVFVVAACLVAPRVWKSNARTFRESCLSKPGWRKALWQYHLYAAPLCLVVASMIVAGFLLPDCVPSKAGRLLEAARPLLLVGVVLVIAVGGVWTHRRLKRILEPLQRDVAVSLAQRELHQRLWIEGHPRLDAGGGE